MASGWGTTAIAPARSPARWMDGWRSAARSIALSAIVGVSSAASPAAGAPRVVLTDVTAASGIDFVETIGDREMSNIVEATGTGCGFLDYDGDGWLDIYLVNGCWLAGLSDPKVDPVERKRLEIGRAHV